ncbi:substrate-binding periplasmic protein [Pseudomonas guariconensis]|uniref:substrate-binding periplasmic protein n=1 Tax=Pseudomonas guariconensis TaxID=1288410 RepID=UPI0018A8A6EA|nr:transporter substrate-binding domain-containing protein [Pseudomonas guariconensis]MBF8722998.1 transporter substrate-binding domain-containing protein [Pseudomonas guariconensis]MBF8793518.1 transporter substrate-binding domain-containing protein [Pseudomonas monteilii]
MIRVPGLKALSRLLVFAALSQALLAQAGPVVEVRVGGAHFPPYTVRPEQGAESGLLPQVLKALNQLQQQYHFVLVPTSVPRRFGDFQQGRTDIAMFENPEWGWDRFPHQSVDLGLEDAEIFVARQQPGRGQEYFENLQGKRLALFNGYHYAFANFNSDPYYLGETYDAILTYSHDSNLLMVERGRVDIALVTRSYFIDFCVRRPDIAKQFLASERIDQRYRHYAILRPESPIDAKAFASLIRRLHDNGEMLRIFQPYRVKVVRPSAD